VTSLAGLVRDAGRTPRIAVTFDDGYADFRSAAVPLLREYGVPATLFVTTNAPADAVPFWWDVLEHAILAPSSLPDALDLEVREALVSWRADLGDRQGLYGTLHRVLGRLPGPERAERLAEITAWAGVDGGVRATHRPLGADDVMALAGTDGIDIGAHGVHHSFLSALDPVEQVREIGGSRRWLEDALGRPVEHFSYPHGDHGPMTVDLVRTAGFRVACTSTPAPVVGRANPLTLPRVEVPDVDGPAFARWLDGWTG
jgi:peptidoglycan/xylan/chitin deacetylase (PgdA/CDA1 family)